MARRRGKLGDHLAVDDYYGTVVYASKLRKDYWNNLTVKPLKRNLQEIASPLHDPRPVSMQRGPDYEQYNICDLKTAPLYVGTTNVRMNTNSAALQSSEFNSLYNVGLGDMEVGCSLIVR